MEATLRGCRVYYRYTPNEKARGATVLLLHGWGCDSSIFSFIEAALAEDASVLALDFPGHGKSAEPPEPWGVPEYAEQVRELLSALSIGRVKIVAHSFGARLAVWLAAKHPELVEQMVVTGGAGIRKAASPRQRRRQKRFKRYQALLEAVGGLKPFAPAAQRLQDGLRARYGSPDYVKLDEVMRKTFVKVIALDLLPELENVHAPTLLIWGDADTETPLWMGQEMEKRIPDAGLVIFEGRSHFAFIEEWQRFSLIVKSFFGGGQKP